MKGPGEEPAERDSVVSGVGQGSAPAAGVGARGWAREAACGPRGGAVCSEL